MVHDIAGDWIWESQLYCHILYFEKYHFGIGRLNLGVMYKGVDLGIVYSLKDNYCIMGNFENHRS